MIFTSLSDVTSNFGACRRKNIQRIIGHLKDMERIMGLNINEDKANSDKRILDKLLYQLIIAEIRILPVKVPQIINNQNFNGNMEINISLRR